MFGCLARAERSKFYITRKSDRIRSVSVVVVLSLSRKVDPPMKLTPLDFFDDRFR